MYDAIVVGARCAGSPVAMLLARRGYGVLVLDRARFPSDTVSTHYVHQPGIARLKEWGLFDRVRATGCPPICEMGWNIEASRLPAARLRRTASPRPLALAALSSTASWCRRRGRPERSSGVPVQRLEYNVLPGLGAVAFPTNDGLVMVGVAWSAQAHPAGVRADLQQQYLAALQRFPALAERVLPGKRVERFAGMASIANLFRRSAGPGWALVGDAGYHKDPAAAQGITDAFRDAEQLAETLDGAFTRARELDDALAEYARRRDEAAIPWYRWALRFARLDELTPPMRDLFSAIAADQEWANRFCGLNAETVNPDSFFALPKG